ncbi:hypothetical protein [Rhizobium leguminosarum]|uniref:hypothetical protein n=1 Tax=Rhizobium leguminosarum TaxID=384 RepID=UPI003F98D640
MNARPADDVELPKLLAYVFLQRSEVNNDRSDRHRRQLRFHSLLDRVLLLDDPACFAGMQGTAGL